MNVRSQINVVIADDHEIFRDGLKLILKKQEKVNLIGEADNGMTLIEVCKQQPPDVILMDIVMPALDGIQATKILMKEYPQMAIIALSMFNEENLIVDMLEAGAKGYLLKNADKEEIGEAIQSVYKNIPYYCRSTTSKLAKLIARSKYQPSSKPGKLNFSEKEIQIVELICKEMTNKEISEKLFMSARTVEGYRLKILEKMQVKSTAGLVIYAIRNGLYKIQE
jgi:DNA-binding NarL/FixJ family response regulator